nr:MAG TPA: hypothetical protein [Caudoviricetes sp.]
MKSSHLSPAFQNALSVIVDTIILFQNNFVNTKSVIFFFFY